jgi:hypothetical protein
MLSEGTPEALEEVFAGFAATAFNPAHIANKQSVVGVAAAKQLAAGSSKCRAAARDARHNTPSQQQQQQQQPVCRMVGCTSSSSSVACMVLPVCSTSRHTLAARCAS